MNFEIAVHRFGDDRAFFQEMSDEFKSSLPARIDEIKAAMQAGDTNQLSRLAHNLKGVSLNFSAEPLANIAARLEICGTDENLTEVASLMEQLALEAQRLEAFLSSQELRS